MPAHAEKQTAVPRSEHPLTSGSKFHLGQPWTRSLDQGFRPCEVRLSWTPAALLVEANLADDEVFTKATADNQKMWELGDVFEVFLQVEGRREFVELHVVPNGFRVHAHLPGPRGMATPTSEPLAFESMLVSPVGFTAKAVKTKSGWRVSERIPAAILGLDAFRPGQDLRISFCRYDGSPGGEPVLSTSASHPVISFHRPDEWAKIRLAQ